MEGHMQRRNLKDHLSSLIKKFIGAGVVPLAYNVRIEARHANGELFAERKVHNMIMDAGEDVVAKMIGGIAANPFTYIAMGTDNTAPADSQTALVSEITSNGGARAADSAPSTSGNVLTVQYQFNITGALAIQEAGLFNSSSGGDMLARQTFAVINVDNGDSVTIIWEITAGTPR